MKLPSLHDLAFEPEDKKSEPLPVQNVSRFPVATQQTVPSDYGFKYEAPDQTVTTTIYNSLVAATNPDSSPTLNRLNALARPLESIITDKKIRTKAVMAQTSMTPKTVGDAIDGLLSALETESQRFSEGKASKLHEMEASKSEIDVVSQKINELKTKLSELTSKVAEAEQAIESKQAAFRAAYERRKAELLLMKTEY